MQSLRVLWQWLAVTEWSAVVLQFRLHKGCTQSTVVFFAVCISITSSVGNLTCIPCIGLTHQSTQDYDCQFQGFWGVCVQELILCMFHAYSSHVFSRPSPQITCYTAAAAVAFNNSLPFNVVVLESRPQADNSQRKIATVRSGCATSGSASFCSLPATAVELKDWLPVLQVGA